VGIIEIIIFGILQGIAEFLPVSSSGHIVVAQNFFDHSVEDLSLNIAVHAGTLLTILIYYREKWWQLVRGVFTREPKALSEFKLIIIATLPTGLIGIAIKSLGMTVLSSLSLTGFCFLITGCVLYSQKWISPKVAKTELNGASMSPVQSFIMGLVQGIAVLPGLSRSGLTIVTGLWLGVDREESARLSFFISVPAILGAVFLELLDGPLNVNWPALFGAGLVAFLVGMIAISVVVGLTKKDRLSQFSWYLWPPIVLI